MSKRKPPKVHSDLGTPERRQHGPMVLEAVPEELADTTNRDRVRALELDDPLFVYRRNRIISVSQRDAGLALRALWNRCGLQPSVVGRYEELIAAGSVQALRARSVDHYQRFVHAVREVGPAASSEVMSVVCLQEFLPTLKQQKNLRQGLDILRREFGS